MVLISSLSSLIGILMVLIIIISIIWLRKTLSGSSFSLDSSHFAFFSFSLSLCQQLKKCSWSYDSMNYYYSIAFRFTININFCPIAWWRSHEATVEDSCLRVAMPPSSWLFSLTQALVCSLLDSLVFYLLATGDCRSLSLEETKQLVSTWSSVKSRSSPLQLLIEQLFNSFSFSSPGRPMRYHLGPAIEWSWRLVRHRLSTSLIFPLDTPAANSTPSSCN
jgi:hypothetical protein